jgi:TPR repeat protein
MSTVLNMVNTNKLPKSTKSEIDVEIEKIISRHKNNRYEINKLVFESVAALTVSENSSQELASQGLLKRFFHSITGKNQKLQTVIDGSLAVAQYASQQILQKLAEQNLMSFELITVLNNKLNASLVQVEGEINKVYGALITFFKQTKSDIIQLENRVERLEKNVNLLNWQNSIEYQIWDGVEYSELDDVSKIVCLTRDFYDITQGRWNISDLLLLKTAMSTVGISPKTEISYNKFILEVSENIRLMTKLFENLSLDGMEQYPEYIAIVAGIRKSVLLGRDEKYLIDNTLEVLHSHSCTVSETEIKEELIEIYERDKAQINLKTPIYAYDMILEMLYNLEQLKEIQYAETLDEKLKEIELLFSVYDTEKLIPLLEELMQYGVTKAKYIMALLYETGCNNLKRDDDKCIQLLDECIFEGYLPAMVRKIFPLYREYDDEAEEKEIPVILADLEKQADEGDVFAIEACGRVYYLSELEYVGMDSEVETNERAEEYFKKSPLVLGCNGLGDLYDYLYDYEEIEEADITALSHYLKAANMGYNPSEYMIGEYYKNGYGTEENPELAFQYYMRAYEHGNWEAIEELGNCFLNGYGTEKDDDLMYKFFSEGAKLEYPNCIKYMGGCYQNGRGVEKDLAKAKECYQRAADMGDKWAQKRLEEEWF